MSLLIKYDQLLKNAMKFCIKSVTLWKKDSIGNRYAKKNFWAKIKSYGGKISKGFHDKKIPTGSFHFVCVPVIVIESVYKIERNY